MRRNTPQRLLGQDVALGRIGAQPDDGGDVAHVPAFLEHQHRDDGLERAFPAVDPVGLATRHLELILVFAAGCFGDVAVLLGLDYEHRAFQLGADVFEVRADVVAVARVVHHHEEHGLLAQALVLLKLFFHSSMPNAR